MKQTLKNILLFVSGGIFFSVVAVYATLVISSSDITYQKQDGTSTTVDLALNELFKERYENEFSIYHNSYQGTRQAGSQTSLNLQKGRYVLFALETYSNVIGNTYTPYSTTDIDEGAVHPLVTTTSGNCTYLGSYKAATFATSTIANGKYINMANQYSIYDCNLTVSANITIKENLNSLATLDYPDRYTLIVSAHAVKID